MARPSDYSPDLAVEIAWRSAEGKSLKTICEGRGMPTLRTVFRWRRDHAEFDRLLQAAHADKADILFEEMIEIADDPVADAAEAARARNRIQARQWACAKLRPDRYAERSVNAHVLPSDPEKPFSDRTPHERMEFGMHLAFMLRVAAEDMRREREGKAATDA